MNVIKAIWKKTGSRVWLIVTAVLLVLMIAVNILMNSTFYSIVCLYLGSKRAIYDSETVAYYPVTTGSKDEAREEGASLTQDIASEGITMVKNEGGALPLSHGASISVFGKNSVDIVFGGSGSGGGDTSESSTLYEGLEAAGFDCNPTLKSFYEDDSLSGDPRDDNPDIENDGNVDIEATETPVSSYTDTVKNSYEDYSDAAIIVISRIAGEGFDLPRTSSDDADRHYLELAPNEQDMISMVCAAGFDSVILVVNSANAMELGFVEDGTYGEIDACLLFPGPGSTGTLALGEVLSGKVNPSGHTADTFVADLTQTPTWNNFADNNQTNPDGDSGDRYDSDDVKAYFVDYEEGVYVGYRYYETRGYTDGEDWYSETVVYPFGYGLSYSTFSWEVDASSLENTQITADGTYEVTVSVTNDKESDYAGKDVIEIYASAPYTAGGIEKPHKVLVGFAKTDLLDPGETGEYTVEIDPYSFASYDYNDANGNGFTGYELEGGTYTLYVGGSAHDEQAAVSFSVAAGGIQYATDPDTGAAVENRYDDADDHLNAGGVEGGTLSRSDWDGTWPTAPEGDDYILDEDTLASLQDTSTNNPTDFSDAEMPTTGASYTSVNEETGEEETSYIQLREMHGVDYDDGQWDLFLDQFTADEMVNIYNNAAFQTYEVERLGVPYTKESDGPVGFCNFMSDKHIYGTNAYTCEVMIAQTWNVELAEDMGNCLGEEGKWGDSENRVSGVPYSGLYGPGANIHRSAFGGRNFEYFSEDSFLTGMMAAYEIKGGQDEGIFMTMKHFALNEQETHRSTGLGSCSWVTEQAMREIFLKPFEMAVKIADNHAIMSSFNRIGSRWTGGDYRLLTELLRDEWGFQGLVICDFNTNSYMNTKQEAYAGGDLNLTESRWWNSFSSSSAADVTIIRNAMHNVMFVLANSNAVNGEIIGYGMPYWQIVLICVDVALGVGCVVWGVFSVRSALKKAKKEQMA